MFENIIEQGAVLQLRDDILSRRLAPSMLFFGPPESGKGSAALELSRVLSCENDASWKCSCPSCERSRYLQHSDLLVLGPRSFTAEISACASVFLRNSSNQSAKLLFIRSLRKLQMRFSPVLMEDDPKLGKLSPALQSLEEGLSEFWLTNTQTADKQALEKICSSLVKNALSLSGGLSANIPVESIRKAAYWCRLAPNGKRKTLVIENAENMRDEGRNSLLKLLEEPPQTVNIVLTSQRREAMIPTILSRLRQYRFLRRSAEVEKDVIRRVFQDTVDEKVFNAESGLIGAYLNSFVTADREKLYPLAAWFIASAARMTAVLIKRKRREIPWIVSALGENYAPIADNAGFERALRSTDVVRTIIAKTENFENVSFSAFLGICLDMVSSVIRKAEDPQYIAHNEIIKKYFNEAETAVNILNLSKELVLEALMQKIKTGISG